MRDGIDIQEPFEILILVDVHFVFPACSIDKGTTLVAFRESSMEMAMSLTPVSSCSRYTYQDGIQLADAGLAPSGPHGDDHGFSIIGKASGLHLLSVQAFDLSIRYA